MFFLCQHLLLYLHLTTGKSHDDCEGAKEEEEVDEEEHVDNVSFYCVIFVYVCIALVIIHSVLTCSGDSF